MSLGWRLLAASVTLGSLIGATGQRAATAFAPADTPYLPLLDVVSPGQNGAGCDAARAVNELPMTERTVAVADLARWYTHLQDEGANVDVLGRDCQGSGPTTLASALTAAGALVSAYRNGSAVSQASIDQRNAGEAADLETVAPLSIATFWPGKPATAPNVALLRTALDAATTSVTVKSAAAVRPRGTASSWPYLASRGAGVSAGTHSTSTYDVVSWVRVDDELMKLVAPPVVSGGVVTLSVQRGLFGTGATTHAVGAKLLSPVYIGTHSVVSTSTLNGTPYRADPNWALRYQLKIWQPEAVSWLAGRITAGIDPVGSGYTEIWLDVSACNFFQVADAYGHPVLPWDDPHGRPLTTARWGAYQKDKLAMLRTALPGLRFAGNALRKDTGCNRDLLATAYDEGALESWMATRPDFSVWPAEMSQLYWIAQGDLPARLWVHWERLGVNYTDDPAQLQRFSYGSLLLAYRPTARRFAYGGGFGLAAPAELFRWDWGTPSSTPTGLADVVVPGTPLYRRDFAGGIVVVNPTAAPVSYPLGGTYYDVVHKDGSGQPGAVSSVTIPAGDAAFLLSAPPP